MRAERRGKELAQLAVHSLFELSHALAADAELVAQLLQRERVFGGHARLEMRRSLPASILPNGVRGRLVVDLTLVMKAAR